MRRGLIALLFVSTMLLPACGDGGGGDDDGASGGRQLRGLLRLSAGECGAGGVASGSSFRMVQPDGSVADGPWVENGDSPCGDITWTPLSPGTDGGLRVGDYQPHPNPAFVDGADATASAIVQPATWFAVKFAAATNPDDPQTGHEAPAPRLEVDDDGSLSGDLSSFAAAWNGQHFNQGAPKPGGQRPGKTTGPSGTYDSKTGEVVLEWTSQIVGGAFNNFTGVWHFEGTFEPA